MLLALPGCSDGGPQKADSAPPGSGARRVALRWERVVRFEGTGDRRTSDFAIASGALQWRVALSCSGRGRVRVSIAGSPKPLLEATCPSREFGFSIRTGSSAVDVVATAPWELVVDQQLDTPIAEPPLPGMTGRNEAAAGNFYGMEQNGRGTATLYRLPDGRRALRLDPFWVTPNTDLVVWGSTAGEPRTSEVALKAPHVQLAELKSTAGPQNYLIPDQVPASHLRSVVVWCVPVRIAYAAAVLDR